MDKIEKLVKLLTNLLKAKFKPSAELNKTVDLIEEILETIFEIEITNTELNEDNKKVIGPLIAKNLSTIGTWVSVTIDDITEYNTNYFKMPRSGLEFLLERYKELPDGEGKSLAEAFEYFKEIENIEGWDKQIQIVNTFYDTNIPCNTSNEPLLNIQERARIPKNHWWWTL